MLASHDVDGPRPGAVGRRRGRSRSPQASVVAAPPVVEAVLSVFSSASPCRRRKGKRRPRREKVRDQPRGGIVHGRSQQDKDGRPRGDSTGRGRGAAATGGRPRRNEDGRPRGGSWRRSHATGRGMRAVAAKQGRLAAEQGAGRGMWIACGRPRGRRYAAGRGGRRTAGRRGDRTRLAAARQGQPAAGGILQATPGGRPRRSEDGRPRGDRTWPSAAEQRMLDAGGNPGRDRMRKDGWPWRKIAQGRSRRDEDGRPRGGFLQAAAE